MTRSPWFWAAIGGLAGAAVALATALVEMFVRGIGPAELQLDSAAVWVAESLPGLLGLGLFFLARTGERRAPPKAPPVSVSTLAPPPPVPDGVGKTASPQIETRDGIRTRTIVEEAPSTAAEGRVKALSELVRVLKEQGERTSAESRAKSSYLANMSHELRNPLSAIVGYAELLQEEAEEQRLSQAVDLKKVAQAGRHLLTMINNLVDLSKIEVGQLAVVLQDVDVAQVVEEVRVEVGFVGMRSEVSFSTQVSPRVRLVRGDHGRIRQILTNLLTHAFQVTKRGQISLMVDRASPKRDAWIALKVRDSGPGMTQAEIERAFDHYAEFADRAVGGGRAGLELAIARQLAELMGGRIDTESEKGVGTTFTVILPPGKSPEDTIAPRSSIALNERLAGIRILLVDGEAFGLSLLKYLERAGLDVKLVTQESSAQLAVEAERPKIVVVDCGLAGAWTLIEDLIVDGVKVVATSVRDDDVERALQLGVTAFLVRPIERRLVLATLERCL
ncbi:MAG: ATP-binding protein [Myxococcota bacterium]